MAEIETRTRIAGGEEETNHIIGGVLGHVRKIWLK